VRIGAEEKGVAMSDAGSSRLFLASFSMINRQFPRIDLEGVPEGAGRENGTGTLLCSEPVPVFA
jgi:hypothetical protein